MLDSEFKGMFSHSLKSESSIAYMAARDTVPVSETRRDSAPESARNLVPTSNHGDTVPVSRIRESVPDSQGEDGVTMTMSMIRQNPSFVDSDYEYGSDDGHNSPNNPAIGPCYFANVHCGPISDDDEDDEEDLVIYARRKIDLAVPIPRSYPSDEAQNVVKKRYTVGMSPTDEEDHSIGHGDQIPHPIPKAKLVRQDAYRHVSAVGHGTDGSDVPYPECINFDLGNPTVSAKEALDHRRHCEKITKKRSLGSLSTKRVAYTRTTTTQDRRRQLPVLHALIAVSHVMKNHDQKIPRRYLRLRAK